MPVAIRAISLTRRRPGTGLCTNMNVLDRFNRHYRLLATGLVAPLVVCLILLPFRDSVPNTSAALLLVLVGVGVAVTEIACRGREQQAMASARLGYLDGVEATAKIAAEGSSSPSALIERVAGQIVQVMALEKCRFDYGMGLDYPRLEPDGSIRWRSQSWAVDSFGLPADKDTELVVESGGRFMGRFLLRANPRTRPSRAERMVAAALAAQVGAALGAYRDPRSSE